MKKPELNKLDKRFREVINERDNGTCQYCGGSGNNVHHIVGRRNRSTRWLVDNGILLCPGCHTFRTNSFHQDPLETITWFEETYPERYQAINERKNKILKQTFEEVLKELEEVWEEL
jgi:5-methylcytosine-specific restriction endonuclease McrA